MLHFHYPLLDSGPTLGNEKTQKHLKLDIFLALSIYQMAKLIKKQCALERRRGVL